MPEPMVGFEPTTYPLRGDCSTCWATSAYATWAEEETWTPDLLLTMELLCQLSYLGNFYILPKNFQITRRKKSLSERTTLMEPYLSFL